jgi:DnaJ-class molecular chaperone
MEEDYYKVLNVSRGASESEIQSAYRKLARKHHPDLNPDDKTAQGKFKKVQQAYDVLSDPAKREQYDRYGSAFESMGGAGPRPGGQGATWTVPPGASFEEIDLGDLFGDRMGGGGGFADLFKQFTAGSRRAGRAAARGQPQRGVDLIHELEVPFTTAVTGGKASLRVQRADSRIETIDVKIPPGIEDGRKIRLRGQGETPPGGGEPGDILITVRVGKHPYFRRDGRNLELSVPVTLAEAALGARIDVPTPKGTVTVTVPKGTSGGKKLRIKGHGICDGESAGDLLAELLIVLPEKLSDEELQQIKKLSADRPANPRGDLRW